MSQLWKREGVTGCHFHSTIEVNVLTEVRYGLILKFNNNGY